MRYLKYVRVDEVVTRAKKMERAKIIRNKGQALSSFPKSKPKNVVARGQNMEDAGNARLASIERGEEAARETTPGGRRASISVGRGAGESRRKALAALNTSFVPLTLPNLTEGDWTRRGYDPRKKRNWPKSERGGIVIPTGNNNNNNNDNAKKDDRTSGATWPTRTTQASEEDK